MGPSCRPGPVLGMDHSSGHFCSDLLYAKCTSVRPEFKFFLQNTYKNKEFCIRSFKNLRKIYVFGHPWPAHRFVAKTHTHTHTHKKKQWVLRPRLEKPKENMCFWPSLASSQICCKKQTKTMGVASEASKT